MSENKEKVCGRLDISVYVTCPHCDDLIDLMKCDELIEEGWIHDVVMPKNKHWGGACKEFSKQYLDSFGDPFCCPKCDKEINIGEIEY